ncbi:Phytochrome-like protein cph2 [Sulfurospirillum diekertiae]|uniref:Phytochrome-like protein cph2 n=1 Tax=Sulfurospirillum diekertiae TaxID=1854492 RepID=A0A1Y0HRK8_9BACT|nr:EAL domain-containing protein [Sulfurospirillum diekertiae]ARU49955.1 Phytochrome-like protein cph2 [Sulfurospirillum diekertiae]ASC94743.1 Phytochrome-like protein cph2 [Sulfurospirillum diekertiae]
MSPLSFISLAEDTGLILPIGLWVLESACAKLKQWEKHPNRQTFKMAINVSSRQFRQPNYVSEVEEVLKKSGVNPALLKFELTESLVLEDSVGSIEKMYELKKLGVTFSMDDFGTGYSSLSYLTQLPLSQLKIDKSFIDNIPGEKNNEMVTRTIIAMGEGMEINVIAEGVETQVQKEFLLANGCQFFQGYLFSRPLPDEELEAFLDENGKLS